MERIMIIPFLLDRIKPNPWQTRTQTDDAHVKELAADILKNGLLQKPVGRLVQSDGQVVPDVTEANVLHQSCYVGVNAQLAFGHNRLAAYRYLAAGQEVLDTENSQPIEYMAMKYFSLQVEIRSLSDQDMADFAWSENEKRAGVTAIDQALHIQRIIHDFNYTQAEAAQHLGMSRSTLANKLRLADALPKLPEDVQQAARTGALSERSIMALLPLAEIPDDTRSRLEQRQESWKTKPSDLLKEAAAGRLTDSDRVREKVESIIQESRHDLSDVPFIDFFVPDGSHPDILSPVCSSCPLVINGQTNGKKKEKFCNHANCFERKGILWQQHVLAEAIAATGLQPLDSSIGNEYSDLYDLTKAHKALDENHCENLRLHYSTYASQNQILPHVYLACQHGKGQGCRCMKAFEAAENKISNAKTKEARKTLNQDIVEPSVGNLAFALNERNPQVWYLILKLLDYNAKEDLTYLQIVDKFARRIVKDAMPYAPEENLEHAKNRLEAVLKAAGISVPWSKDAQLDILTGKWLRIEKWLKNLSSDFPSREAIKGNLNNLAEIVVQRFDLPADLLKKIDDSSDMLLSILNIYDAPGFQTWTKSDANHLGDILRTSVEYARPAIAESSAQLCNYCLALIGSQEQRDTIRKMLNARLLHLASLLDGQQGELPIDQTIPTL